MNPIEVKGHGYIEVILEVDGEHTRYSWQGPIVQVATHREPIVVIDVGWMKELKPGPYIDVALKFEAKNMKTGGGMSKAKVHSYAGPFGWALCGKKNVDTTMKQEEVTCKTCLKTLAKREGKR